MDKETEKEFEDLWNNWVYLADIKIGVNFNAFKVGIKSVFKDHIAKAHQAGRREVLEEVRKIIKSAKLARVGGAFNRDIPVTIRQEQEILDIYKKKTLKVLQSLTKTKNK